MDIQSLNKAQVARDAEQIQLQLRTNLDFDAIYTMTASLYTILSEIPELQILRHGLKDANVDYRSAAQDDFMARSKGTARMHSRAIDHLDRRLARIIHSAS